MAYTLDDATVETLLRLHPWVRSRAKEEQPALALAAVLDAEACRRGGPDPVSGALNVLFLTQGALLKPEYDISIHAHVPWEVGLLTVDVLELIRVNQAAGFSAGDALLRTVAGCLVATFPVASVVRIHTDCFCVLFLPSSGTDVTEEVRTAAHAALHRTAADFLLAHPRTPAPLDFTLGLARLRVVNPSHWQVLGPLVWAEAERTHVLARAQRAEGILLRTVELDGRVAVAPEERSPATRRRE
ncbi:MAG: diguanylate cyclase domain-containing protein [Myxococcaceae bacterium]